MTEERFTALALGAGRRYISAARAPGLGLVPCAFCSPSSVHYEGRGAKACNRCHRRKKRCRFSSSRWACDGCLRAEEPCGFTVTAEHGRHDADAVSLRPPAAQGPGHLTEGGRRCALACLTSTRDDFIAHFFGPGYAGRMHAVLLACLPPELDGATGICSAMYEAFEAARCNRMTDSDVAAWLQVMTSAIELMRRGAAPGLACGSPLPWIGLGFAIGHLSHVTLGCSAGPVRRFILGHIVERAGAPLLPAYLCRNPLLLFLVGVDLNEALLRREMPVCDLKVADGWVPDPCLGLCLPLMPALYELAVLSHRLRDGTPNAADLETLARLRDRIASWNLSTLCSDSRLFHGFNADEVVHMTTQARVYQLMGQLLTTRVLASAGCGDPEAAKCAAGEFASQILHLLRQAAEATSTTHRFVAMPYFAAAVEAIGNNERDAVLDMAWVFTSAFMSKAAGGVSTALRTLWALEDRLPGGLWLDRVPEIAPFSLAL
ncbi:hypothetical protein CSAL01_11926 [Colletotrichum salicis]|uniref:Zn(2)-C6 fungal-type domain-containing protein n=1 Tax=Colletotrichum salicis TaxID=1209931 RepID=A0A135U6Q9_9PEZI|nr:hypothetical protein CSAL01_11926 [Colletotrichum salicis]